MHTHIITTGTSPVAIINCVWSLFHKHQLFPDHIILLATDKNQQSLDKAIKGVRVLCKHKMPTCKVDSIIIDETNIHRSVEIIKKFVHFLNHNDVLTMDLTPGRKTMSVAVMLAARYFREEGYNLRGVFYLHLKDSSYRDVLYPLIPHTLYDMVLLEGAE